MLFNIPYRVLMRDDLVSDDLVLVEAPGRQLAAAVPQCGARVHVDEPHERPDTVPGGVLTVPVHYLHTPEVLSRHRHVIVDVARHLLEFETRLKEIFERSKSAFRSMIENRITCIKNVHRPGLLRS